MKVRIRVDAPPMPLTEAALEIALVMWVVTTAVSVIGG